MGAPDHGVGSFYDVAFLAEPFGLPFNKFTKSWIKAGCGEFSSPVHAVADSFHGFSAVVRVILCHEDWVNKLFEVLL